jgi:hypothetical protein
MLVLRRASTIPHCHRLLGDDVQHLGLGLGVDGPVFGDGGGDRRCPPLLVSSRHAGVRHLRRHAPVWVDPLEY